MNVVIFDPCDCTVTAPVLSRGKPSVELAKLSIYSLNWIQQNARYASSEMQYLFNVKLKQLCSSLFATSWELQKAVVGIIVGCFK